MPFAATWMDLEMIILNKVSEKETKIPYDIIAMCNLKYDTNELIYETETDSQTYRTDLWLPRESVGGGGMDWEFEISRCKLLYIFQKN